MKFSLVFAAVSGPGFLALGLYMILTDIEGAGWAFLLGSVFYWRKV